ncbi:hypothetical protein ACH3XW_0320 [Acanthocheilonema viteae]
MNVAEKAALQQPANIPYHSRPGETRRSEGEMEENSLGRPFIPDCRVRCNAARRPTRLQDFILAVCQVQ